MKCVQFVVKREREHKVNAFQWKIYQDAFVVLKQKTYRGKFQNMSKLSYLKCFKCLQMALCIYIVTTQRRGKAKIVSQVGSWCLRNTVSRAEIWAVTQRVWVRTNGKRNVV